MPKKKKGKKKKGKKRVAPEPPPYYKVTLPQNYLFGEVIGKSLFVKNDLEDEAQRRVDALNAKSLTLNLQTMKLDELPLRLHRLINLTTLNLQGNNLFSTERLFAILSQCKELVEINLSYNMLNGSLPDTVDSLVRLQKLNLRGNEITQISPNLSRCEMMTEFDIGNNKIVELPVEVFHTWKELQTLKLKGNKLSFLPPELSKLTSLKYIDASKNNIASLPGQAFNDLKELTFLNLSTNGIVSVPDELGSCEELSYLNVSDNGITHISGSIFLKLKKLEYLFMYKNKIVALPPELGAATSLRIVSFANNKISSLPNGIGLLHNLEEIYVGGNTTLRTLPGTVHGWKKIRAIYCQGCTKMKSLPFEIELCTTLKDLDLNSGKKKQTCQYPKDLKEKLPKLKIRGKYIIYSLHTNHTLYIFSYTCMLFVAHFEIIYTNIFYLTPQYMINRWQTKERQKRQKLNAKSSNSIGGTISIPGSKIVPLSNIF